MARTSIDWLIINLPPSITGAMTARPPLLTRLKVRRPAGYVAASGNSQTFAPGIFVKMVPVNVGV
ncbi:hypothetical protein Cabther_B0422 [Chloracidobacterium thermophilum B]|uniref:Uncharacterized protein n=1 Tax=Chloracidobacterium thermophilum (strain B) TaxID=981222 RepID=G2LLE8_CHLTF|nr:hypothetical protein Cabther_B0422 [Chloracidobacterium thermophilum B]